jgi:uncharacterized protein YuzE
MAIRYDPGTDTLEVKLGPSIHETYDIEAGDFTATLDEGDGLIAITIAHASRFVADALRAGVKVEGGPAVTPAPRGMVWYDADSSMISAFGYDEAEGVLEVAFHNTGVYRYHDVPRHVFEGLRDASSKGSYLRSEIIDIYPYEKKRGRSRKS